MREIARLGLVRIVRSHFRYLVLEGSVVKSAHWTMRAALEAAEAAS